MDSKFFFTEDCNVFTCNESNSSKTVNRKDVKDRIFKALKQQNLISIKFQFLDFAEEKEQCDYAHYDKKNKFFSRLGFFSNFQSKFDSIS